MERQFTFAEAFIVATSGISWREATEIIPASESRVYLVMDNVEELYRSEFQTFWHLVSRVLGDRHSPIRLLLLGEYPPYARENDSFKPVQIPCHLGVRDINFTQNEIREYVTKWCNNPDVLMSDGRGAFNDFCRYLRMLCGGHIGMCELVVRGLNEWASEIGEKKSLTVDDAILKILNGTIMIYLRGERATRPINKLSPQDLVNLENIALGDVTEGMHGVAQAFVQRGILVPLAGRYEFVSPLYWRIFASLCLRGTPRASQSPENLSDLIIQAIQSIDYKRIRERSRSSGIVMEKSWQLEFYRAMLRVTPDAMVARYELGVLFGTRGWIDFSFHDDWHTWLLGIDVQHDGESLDELFSRFEDGGIYLRWPVTEYCVVDFRRSEDASVEEIARDVDRYVTLFVVRYDVRLSNVVLYNGRNQLSIRT
ncbi:hypothetical protein Poli38472_006416 [Pythium oligandrum]|uniref:Uncharacterized protein n=1 Tax=Pythium oligandrum TaxID=41045 RepID=A0A8K1C4K4_PYTOL|nr:hypothetical protein Poli38472_006416 [Pythium oligandrum]|eukprot:TMW56406.1 hypothetical protein Poli38472_006416 [Pythium oligandrum]